MRCPLPPLTKIRARWLMERCFDVASDEIQAGFSEKSADADARLLLAIQSMQAFNLERRREEVNALWDLFSDPYGFETNSEGTTFWLAMALAIKDLYALDEAALKKLLP